jgi:hypothetical protein
MAASLENEFRIDHKFENNYIATLDMSYNKDINGVHVQNWGLKKLLVV